jgi:hypothetical protein
MVAMALMMRKVRVSGANKGAAGGLRAGVVLQNCTRVMAFAFVVCGAGGGGTGEAESQDR